MRTEGNRREGLRGKETHGKSGEERRVINGTVALTCRLLLGKAPQLILGTENATMLQTLMCTLPYLSSSIKFSTSTEQRFSTSGGMKTQQDSVPQHLQEPIVMAA